MELYIHIPFCRQKCRYCDFASYPNCESIIPAYVDALLSEMDAHLSRNLTVSTIFIGGGTPSLLPPDQLQRILSFVSSRCALDAHAEITCEANPGTLTLQWLQTAFACGVNRISMGMQALQPELLHTLGRIHTHADVVQSVKLVREAGITNLSLDLMFGLPGQTRQMWLDTLLAAIALQPEHLSCYGLIPEDGTPLKADLDAGRLSLPEEETERQMYDDALSLLTSHGYSQYEISNFARPNYACRHNLGYWQRIAYYGFGASAASFIPGPNGAVRWTNPSSIRSYIDMVNARAWERREETPLTDEDERYETLMLGLRLNEGVREDEFHRRHGITLDEYRADTLRRLEGQGLLIHADGSWRLTRRGMDVQNAVLVELMDD